MSKGLFDHPIERDTTPNPPAEIFRRLGIVLLPVAIVLAVAFGLQAIARQDLRAALYAAGCALVCGILMLSRRPRPTRAFTPPPVTTAAPSDSATQPTPIRPRILLLNAGLGGPTGNSARALQHLAGYLSPHAELDLVSLGGDTANPFDRIYPRLSEAHAIVVATGVHWDSWSSPLQCFLEAATPTEATALWLGKPAAVLVTEHSVGGKGVLSRLQGVLVTLGCEIPPLSGLVLSRAGQLARASHPADPAADDLWCTEDLAVVAANVTAAARRRAHAWTTWPVDRSHYAGRWLR